MTGLAFVFGAIFGSFTNVLIHRLPRGESVILPGSRCRSCGRRLEWWENVPILSFLALRGRCRTCDARISPRYLVVEILVAGLFAYCAWRHALTWEGAACAVFGVLLVAVFFIDLEHKIIPDRITLPGMALGLVLSGLRDGPWGMAAGAAAGLGAGGVLLLIAMASRGGMGGGDVKLAAMMGTFLGWPLIGVGLFAGVLIGGLVALVLLATGIKKRKDHIPFGPALAVGGFVAMEWGRQLLRWYLGAFGL
ncbi:MAG: prepilin peptidase [Armatimonadota bacterium]|nr:prepilin peptidase [Armatimonadota bacterium]MDR5697247.1 prepilin peptidase [Armatimonadota bacterium]